jgi:magnesium transporter
MLETKKLKTRIKKTGMPPGILIQTEERDHKVTISVFDYDKDSYREKTVDKIEECFVYKDQPTITWINIDGSHEMKTLEKIGECFQIHPLILEDIMTTGQRPKIEYHDNYIFIVLKMVFYGDHEKQIIDEQLSLLVGNNYVISFQEKPGDPFHVIRDRIRNGLGRIRKMGSDYLAYSLMDIIVDNYFIILEKFGEELEDIEEETLVEPTPRTLQQIHEIKRELIFFRKFIWPLREVIASFNRNESEIIQPHTLVYIRDLYDHVIQLIDSIETFRDIVASILEIYLSSISNKLNVVMKRLTLITTIFMPLTLLASIGGMSEWSMMTGSQNWQITYPIFLVGLAVMGYATYLILKWKGWS